MHEGTHSTIILLAWEHVHACEHFKSGRTDLIRQTNPPKRKTSKTDETIH